MTLNPKTRASLILRIGDPADDAAWAEFLQIYEPMLFRLASRWGLQASDASEVVQETLLAVATAVRKYESKRHEGAFRGWLAAITRNKLSDHLANRARQQTGTGDSDVHRWLEQQVCEASALSVWDWQQKRQIFTWAAARVRKQVSQSTWDAFYRTAVLGEPISDVAENLGIREGMIYVARSRVMSRLRKEVAVWSDSEVLESRGLADEV